MTFLLSSEPPQGRFVCCFRGSQGSRQSGTQTSLSASPPRTCSVHIFPTPASLPRPPPNSSSAPNPRAVCDSSLSPTLQPVPQGCPSKMCPYTNHLSRELPPLVPAARVSAVGASSLLLTPLAHRKPERSSSFPSYLQENPKSLELTKLLTLRSSDPRSPLFLPGHSPALTKKASLLSPSEPVHLPFPPQKCLPPEAPMMGAVPSRSLPKYHLLRASQDPHVQCPSSLIWTP